MTEVCLPELGEGVDKATIACYHHQLGDQVNLDDDVVEVVTDKATFNVPSTTSGVIKKICFKEGDIADIGAALFIVESDSE